MQTPLSLPSVPAVRGSLGGNVFTTTDDGPQLATTFLKLNPLVCSTPQPERFINILLVASSCPLSNGFDLESSNILDADEVVRMAIGLSRQVCV